MITYCECADGGHDEGAGICMCGRPIQNKVASKPKVSEREIIAETIAEVIREMGMTNPFGGDVSLATSTNGRTYYGVLFSRPATLDGFVRVYGPKFILVESSRTGQDKFTSEREAIDFIRETF